MLPVMYRRILLVKPSTGHAFMVLTAGAGSAKRYVFGGDSPGDRAVLFWRVLGLINPTVAAAAAS